MKAVLPVCDFSVTLVRNIKIQELPQNPLSTDLAELPLSALNPPFNLTYPQVVRDGTNSIAYTG
jgi:hypothetical protein